MDVRLAPAVYIIWACATFTFQFSLAAKEGKQGKAIDATKHHIACAHSYTKENVTLQEGINAGKFTNHGMVKDMKACIDKCCKHKGCDLAFKLGDGCYTVECKSDESCRITPATSPNSFGRVDISRVYRNAETKKRHGKQTKQHVGVKLERPDKQQKPNIVGEREPVSKLQNQNENKVDKLQKQSVAGKSEKVQGQNATVNSDKVDKVQNQSSHFIGDKADERVVQLSSTTNDNIQSTKNTCIFRRIVHNQTIMGGLKRREEVKDLGSFADVDDCSQKCCLRENCKVAVIRDNKCFSVQCRTRGYCDSREDPPVDGSANMIIYIKSKNGETLDRRERCRRHCGSGICTNEKTCLCDAGVTGDHCDQLEPVCVPPCGERGTCNSTNTCTCDPGWEGQACENEIICDPPCKNGICVNAHTLQCKCHVGWVGLYCHETNGDKAVLASTGEQVLFTQAEVEPELAIKIPAEKPPLSDRSEPVSAFTVAAFCAMASLFLGIIAVVSMMKQIINKRNALTREYLENAHLIN